MAISGMTGFARTGGEADWGSWSWEARSVNGRGLDVRLSLPSGLETVEQAVRAAASSRFSRGNLQLGLRVEVAGGGERVRVNEGVLTALMSAYEKADGTLATGSALATLMGFKGVVEMESASLRDLAGAPGFVEAISASGEAVLDALQDARLQEGQSVSNLLAGQLRELQSLAGEARTHAQVQKVTLAEKYRARIAEFDVEGAVSEERLTTEIAVLAAKADVMEELDRLDAHITRGLFMLEQGGPIGRDLGFLAQELNREANTLCSKSASLDLTNDGLALKSIIDQFKEQAANVE